MNARPPYEHIGRLLADARAQAGGPDGEISQDELAHRLGVSLTTYGRWERGVRRPKGRWVAKVAKELGIEEELLAEPATPARPVPPDLEDVFYEMRDKIDRLESMVGLLLSARAADLGVDVADPAESFAKALRAGLLESTELAAASTAPDRAPKAPRRAAPPNVSRKPGASAGRSR